MKTIVGSFDSFDEAKRVARDLMDEGFRDNDVNVVASNARGDYSATSTGTAAGTSAVAGSSATTGAGTTSNYGRGDYAQTRGVGDDTMRTDTGTLGRDRDNDRDAADDASGAATGAVTGGVVGGAAGLAASLMGLAIPGIGPIIAAGPIVATLSGAGVGAVAGGLIGGLTDMGVSKTDAEYYAESVRRGGALVTVRADDTRAERAAEIMREHGASTSSDVPSSGVSGDGTAGTIRRSPTRPRTSTATAISMERPTAPPASPAAWAATASEPATSAIAPRRERIPTSAAEPAVVRNRHRLARPIGSARAASGNVLLRVIAR